MKRKLFKSLFAVAAIAAVGLGSYKAYGSYVTANMSEDDLLMMENVLALSELKNPVENGQVEIVTSTKTCHKLVTDTSKKQTIVINVDGKKETKICYWHYDDIKHAANCRLISVGNYNGENLCKYNTLRSCSQYGGTEEEISSDLLGFY